MSRREGSGAEPRQSARKARSTPGPRASGERVAHDRVRHAVAAARAARGRGEDRRHDAAGAVDHRAAGVARAHGAAQRGDRAPHRAAAVGVLGDDLARLAEPPGAHVVRPVEREAEDRGRGARTRVAARARAPARRARRRAGPRCRCAGRTRSPARRGPARGPAGSTRVSSWPATTCALVTTSAVAGDPARALDAERRTRVPRTFTTLRRAASHLRVARDPRRGRRARRAAGPSMRGNGSSARERVQQRPGRRQHVVELRAGSPSAGRRARTSRARAAARPRRAPRRPRARRRPSAARRAAPSIAAKRRATASVARRRAPSPSKPAASTPPASSAPSRRERRRPRRVAAAGSTQRRRSACRARRRARSRRARARRTMNPCAQPKSAEQHHGADDDPVEACHRLRASVPRCAPRPAARRRSGPTLQCAPWPTRSPPSRGAARRLRRAHSAARRSPSVAFVVGAGGRRAATSRPSAALAHALRDGLGARRLRGDARDARRREAQRARLAAPLRRAPTATPPRPRRSRRSSRPAAPRAARRRGRPCRSTSSTRIFGTIRGDVTLPSASTPTARRRSTGSRTSCSPACAPGEQLTRATPRMPAARDDRGPRRHARSRKGDDAARPTSAARLRDRRAASAPRRPSARAELRARGVPDGRAGRPHRARARSSTPSSPARPAASCWPGAACSRERTPQRRARACARRSTPTSSAPRSTALAGRYGGDRGGAAARRRGARARRRRLLGAPAARARRSRSSRSSGALEARRRSSATTSFPVQTAATLEGVELENANGESCGGSLIDVVRALLQLGLRAAGRQARRAAAGRDRRARSASTRTRDLAGAARSHDPRRRRDRRRPRRRLDRDRPGQGAGDAAADGAGGGGDRRGRHAPSSPTLRKGEKPRR